jgi:hypothetical protein
VSLVGGRCRCRCRYTQARGGRQLVDETETRQTRQRDRFLAVFVLQSQVLGKVYGDYGDWDGRGLTDCYQSRRRHSALYTQSGMGRKGTGRYSHVGSSSCICTRDLREAREPSHVITLLRLRG